MPVLKNKERIYDIQKALGLVTSMIGFCLCFSDFFRRGKGAAEKIHQQILPVR